MKGWNRLGLGARTIFITIAIVAAVVAANAVIAHFSIRGAAERDMIDKGASFTAMAEQVQEHTLRLIDSSPVLAQELSDAQRIHAGWLAAKAAAKAEGLEFRLTAIDALAEANDPAKDPVTGPFRVALYKKLMAQIEAGGPQVISATDEEHNAIHYQRAVKIGSQCTSCHADTGKGRAAGLHGAYEIVMPLGPVDAEVQATLAKSVAFSLVLIVLAAVAISLYFRHSVTRRLDAMGHAAAQIAAGDLETRIEGMGEDEIGHLADSFNAMVGYVHEIAAAAEAVSRGDLSVKVTPRSPKDVLSLNFQRAIDNLRRVLAETRNLIDAASAGRLSTRGEAERFEGAFGEMISSVNSLLDAIVAPLERTEEYLERIARGDIPDEITERQRGDFERIKNALNTCISTLNGFVREMQTMAARQGEGDVDAVLPVDKFSGVYRTMAEGVNEQVKGQIGITRRAMDVVRQYGEGDLSVQMDRLPGKQAKVTEAVDLVRSNLLALSGEIDQLIAEALAGNLGYRGDPKRYKDAYARMIDGINRTLDAVTGPLGAAASCIAAIARGAIPSRIEENYPGDFDELRRNLNACIDAIRAMGEDTRTLVAAALAGNLGQRADASRHQGDFRAIVQGINDTLDAVVGPLKTAAGHLDKIARGEIPPPINTRWPGEFDAIRRDLDTCTATVRALVDDVSQLCRAALAGNLAQRADAERHQGDFRRIVQGIDDMLEAVVAPLRVAAANLDRIAHGDIPDPITEQYQGDFDAIRNNLNTCITVIRALVEDAGKLADAAARGELGERADAGRHQGAFRHIVEGVNGALDAMSVPLRDASGALARIAQRDLTTRMTSRYTGEYATMSEAVNTATEHLDDGMRSVAGAAEQVASATRQISTASQELARAAAEEAGSLEEIGANLEEMAASIRNAENNARQAREVTESNATSAAKGLETMARLSAAIEKIKSSSDETAKIVKTIDEIAFQTNLLALNAAVEAARAGDAGKGFAVVAEEVRNLAMRSAEAARNTSELIEGAVRNAEDGVAVNLEAVALFEQIAREADRVTAMVGEIAGAAERQSSDIARANAAVGDINRLTQQTAAHSEETASVAEELSAQAEELRATVGAFRLT